MGLLEKIVELVEEEILGTPYFIVDSSGGEAKRKVVILLDGDDGISIQTCAKVSRKIGRIIEEEEIDTGAFRLEISSPGADQPLKMRRQYPKHIGRSLDILTNDEKKYKGKLLEVAEDSIKLELAKSKKDKKKEAEVIELPFKSIRESKVILSFK